MKRKNILLSFIAIAALLFFVSCQKEVNGDFENGTIDPATLKPKVGTIWTYTYNWYNSPGGAANSKKIYHKATSEETIGGEKWLKIVDQETDTLLYYLNIKADGLYQYTNSNPYLLCKYPATLQDTYNTFNDGSTEDFTISGVNDITATMIGNIPLTKYEGVKAGYIIDEIWYNKNAWIVWKFKYRRIAPPPVSAYYRISSMFLNNIVY